MSKTAVRKKATMTLELERETLAELKAATIIIGAKSYSSLIHQQIVLKIREAKNLVSPQEFEQLRDEQLRDLDQRSRAKSLERQKSQKLKEQKKNVVDPAEDREKISVNAKSGGGIKKAKRTLSTKAGEIPLIREAPSAAEDGGDEEQ